MQKILFVDDDEAIRHVVTRMLPADKYEVITADGGKRALRILMDSKPDLIILDIVMPGMDGIQVLKRIKSNPEMSAIPVIMLTGHKSERTIIKSLELYAEAYLEKPVGQKELCEKVDFILSSRHASAG